MVMAGTALAIDMMLPAFPEIRAGLGLEADSTAVAGMITVFLMGQGIALLPAGFLADRYGRRPVLWGGLGLYVVAALAAAFATSLTTMLIARFIWGMATAGPRVAATAMVRDAFEGAEMAKQMSTIMAVFTIVPTLAPALGAAIVAVGDWQFVFVACAVYAGAVFALTTRLPRTMQTAPKPVDDSWAEVRRALRAIFTTPGTLGYLLAIIGLFASFLSYLASSEIIIDEVFDLASWFPAIFAAMAILMAAVMLVNRQLVVSVGLDRMMRIASPALLVAVAIFVSVSLATSGEPPFWLFFACIAGVIGCQQLLVPNLNAAAMRPLGEVAGTAAAIFGMIPMIFGAAIASVFDRAFDGTTTPLAFGMATGAILATIGLGWSRAVIPAGSLD
jgi:DHA1 family bicyclomycin/chloramphenicol resistance-like MFS transporter